MVQVVENWAEIEGTVEDVSTDAPLNYVNVRLRLARTRPVEGYPNLFEPLLGSVFSLMLPRGPATRHLRLGCRVRARARRATHSSSFADPASLAIEDTTAPPDGGGAGGPEAVGPVDSTCRGDA